MYQVSVTVVVQSPSCHAVLECSGLVLYKALFRLYVLSLLYCCCTELHIIPANVVESRGNADSAISTRLHMGGSGRMRVKGRESQWVRGEI